MTPARGGGKRDNLRVQRRGFTVRGVVQGVGFRPFVYSLAQRHALAGSS